ncbi:cupin domain-containing protein [Vibrio sp. 404]|uniref:Cupin domain-containing protein n=1 Tax=Vibrio marinisediminis TaxID=2758441 RepID=A0A7W2IU66_9VIBR|nr:ChrR family anti-sigma-E factor [Vibrio marinisediminis]MBA5763311.1 cupin domain-containing protein [Vibrio marinisediminis]
MSYHPSLEMLQAYVEGELDAVSGFAIATHIEACPDCQNQCAHLEQKVGELWGSCDVAPAEELSTMFDKIIALEESPEPFQFNRKVKTITVNNKQFTLPVSLSRFADNIGEWKSYGGKVFSAHVDLGEQARVNLLYISENVKIPQHTHKGIESTLILHGGFSDEDGQYEAGDFLLKDGTVKHSPFTQPGEDCLCLTVLTEPLIFTQGVARVFNLFGKGLYP